MGSSSLPEKIAERVCERLFSMEGSGEKATRMMLMQATANGCERVLGGRVFDAAVWCARIAVTETLKEELGL